MKFIKVSRRTSSTVLTLALATAGAAQAQEMGWRSFLSVTPIYQGQGDLDGGGHYSAQSAIVRTGVLGDLGRGNRCQFNRSMQSAVLTVTGCVLPPQKAAVH